MHYDTVISHVPLFRSGRRIAEIDLVGISGDVWDIYEVKSSFRIVKAKKQLKRIQDLVHDEVAQVRNVFFYCGESETLLAL